MTLNRRFVDASSGHIYTHLTYHSCSWRSSMAEQRFCKPAGASEPLVIPMSYKGGVFSRGMPYGGIELLVGTIMGTVVMNAY